MTAGGAADWAVHAALGLVAFMTGLAKVGFAGVASLNVPLMTTLTTPEFAVGAILPLLICGDLLVGWRFFGLWDRRVVLTMIPGELLGVAIGAPLLKLVSESEAVFSRVIGCLALFFATWQWLLNRRRERAAAAGAEVEHRPSPGWVGFLAGVGTAICSTLAHQGGLVSNLYLLSQKLTKERFAATGIGIYLTLNVVKLIPYVAQQKITAETLRYDLSAAPFVLVGVLVGARLLTLLKPAMFNALIYWTVMVLGLKLAVWP